MGGFLVEKECLYKAWELNAHNNIPLFGSKSRDLDIEK